MKWEGGRAIAYTMRTRRRGLTHLSVSAKTPILHILVIFSFERCFHRTFLSLVTTFILLLCTTFAKVIFKLLIECVKNIPVRDGWEGQMGNSTYAMGGGVIASNHVRMISGKGSDFCHFGVYVLIE